VSVERRISISSVVVAARDQVSCDLGGEAAILSRGVYYGLDPVGARIWELVQVPRTIREVRDVLLDEYEVDADRCERDLLELLERLAAKQLVDVEG
jgi:hypothetical protein